MNKTDFLEALRKGLKDYSYKDTQQYTDYYREMIDDRIEEGLTEEEAVADIGTPEEAASRIKEENLLPHTKRQRAPLKTWQIVLIALGSPIWISLIIAAISVIFSLFAVLCAVIISLYAGAASLAVCSIGGIISAVSMLIHHNVPAGIFLVGASLICAGLSILSFTGLNKLTKWFICCITKLVLYFKSRITKKEEV